TSCREDQFTCSGDGSCIPLAWKCDSDGDCPDDSDEELCEEENECGEQEYKCSDDRCIPLNWVCDGEKDCEKGDDEAKCSPDVQCKEGEVLCAGNSTCVAKSKWCDGASDCEDGSDEVDCGPKEELREKCRDNEVVCKSSGSCISYFDVCDDISDCDDGSDEEQCIESCGHADTPCLHKANCTMECQGEEECSTLDYGCFMFECDNNYSICDTNNCYHDLLRCDGDVDCRDGSDEFGCHNAKSKCAEGYAQCKNGTRCIRDSWRCDGERDCPDGSDEADCVSSTSLTALTSVDKQSSWQGRGPTTTTLVGKHWRRRRRAEDRRNPSGHKSLRPDDQKLPFQTFWIEFWKFNGKLHQRSKQEQTPKDSDSSNLYRLLHSRYRLSYADDTRYQCQLTCFRSSIHS
ncbi:very low-density lipoprotein receptor-like, partial [Penaeus japonicus]|uniref:very low-density lipoprotein receptor-like n=1 Tax=Penaeus japonicus TaxID=27405 RepID=UPI001C7126CC